MSIDAENTFGKIQHPFTKKKKKKKTSHQTEYTGNIYQHNKCYL